MFNDYQKQALKTAIKLELNYTLRGIAGETGEVLQKIWFTRTSTYDLEKELGDVFWYCAVSSWLLKEEGESYNFAKVCKSAKGSIFSLDDITRMLAVAALNLMEISKKIDRDGLTDTRKSAIIDVVGDMTYYLRYLINFYQLETSNVLNTNINKLADRKNRQKIQGDGDNR